MNTEAGKRLLDEVNATGEPWRRHMAEVVAAIETEAVAAERDRIADKLRENAHLICACRIPEACPRVAAVLAIVEDEP